MVKQYTACFTGHRRIRKKDSSLKSKLCNIVEKLALDGYVYFVSGGARGFDTLAAETVIDLKEKYTDIKLVMVLPFAEHYKHEGDWSDNEIQKYHKIKNNASEVIYIQKYYSKGCYYARDRYIVDASSVCVKYQYKSTGGTAYTTAYAYKKELKVISCI